MSLAPTGMAAAITSKFSRCERKLVFSNTTAEESETRELKVPFSQYS